MFSKLSVVEEPLPLSFFLFLKTLSGTSYLENFTIIGLHLLLSSLNAPILCVLSKLDVLPVSPNSSRIISRVCPSVSSPFSCDILWKRMQFRLEYCCCRFSEFFSTSNSFDISETFPCKLFIMFSFSFLSASYWLIFLVIYSTASFSSLICNSPLFYELWVFPCISCISLTLFSTFR